MSILAESFLASFDSRADLTWNLFSTSKAVATFPLKGCLVETTFIRLSDHGWQVGFDVTPKEIPFDQSIRVFSGVFQAVKEFLEVRQPNRLVFASKAEDMGRLYETYLQRKDTDLKQMGYEMTPLVKSSPLTEFTIQKTTPSAWNAY